jgi:hypothetical protein
MSANFSLDNFNELMNQANQIITCGPSCMQQNKSQKLEQNYLDAETNMVKAPQQLFTAKKEFLTYTKGENGYNQYINSQLQEKADGIAKTYQTKINDDITKIKTQLKTYNGLLLNFMNVYDLYKKYKVENAMLEKKLKGKTSDTLTNDRKTYYEEQGINNLKFFYIIFLCIYGFIVLVFLLSIFLVKTSLKFSIRIVIFVLLVIYPFVCYWIFHLLYKFFIYIKSYFPKNVYNNL